MPRDVLKPLRLDKREATPLSIPSEYLPLPRKWHHQPMSTSECPQTLPHRRYIQHTDQKFLYVHPVTLSLIHISEPTRPY